MMAVMAVVAMSFTACGGDSDDPLDNSGKETSETYIEPCLDWGCDINHIKTYMGSSMELSNEQKQFDVTVLAYTTSDYKYVLTYALTPKLYQVYVYHYDKNRDYFTKLISQYETRYQTKFEMEEDDRFESYATKCYINGKYCSVLVDYDAKTNAVIVVFSLAE